MPHTILYSMLASALLMPVVGCKRSLIADLPQNAPLVGEPILASGTDATGKNTPTYALMVPVCNREPAPLHAKLYVQSGMSEIDTPGRWIAAATGEKLFMEFRAPTGTYCWFGLCNIKKQRTHPIRLRLTWQAGAKAGNKVFTVAPEQTDNVT
ncbi:MAG: hypothetical protein JO316_17105 [Abitibacteriaceae bacterium]|nr:hypothetical protein [Abditibacteriaceae bacterium]